MAEAVSAAMGASSAIIRGDLGAVGTSSRRVTATRVEGSGARAGGAQRAAKSSSSGFRGSSLVGTNLGRRLRVAARAVSDPSMTGWDAGNKIDEKEDVVGVLLLNLGGPETLDDVQPFLYNLFADPDIIRLPGALQFLQSPLAALLSNSRAPKSREAYESIGGGSPLRRITDEQANALHEKSAVRKDTVEDQVADEIDPELWASSVATALAFRAFQNGVEASRTESPKMHDQTETQTETKPETLTPSPTLSPGDRLFKFAASCPATGDDVGSDPESDDSQPHWDIDVTSANSVSFLGATLREGQSPPRSSPVQMFDEGRLPRVGASALFRVATGSI